MFIVYYILPRQPNIKTYILIYYQVILAPVSHGIISRPIFFSRNFKNHVKTFWFKMYYMHRCLMNINVGKGNRHVIFDELLLYY